MASRLSWLYLTCSIFVQWHHRWKVNSGFLLAGFKICICEIHKALLEAHSSCDLECLVTGFQELLGEGRVVCLQLLHDLLRSCRRSVNMLMQAVCIGLCCRSLEQSPQAFRPAPLTHQRLQCSVARSMWEQGMLNFQPQGDSDVNTWKTVHANVRHLEVIPCASVSISGIPWCQS